MFDKLIFMHAKMLNAKKLAFFFFCVFFNSCTIFLLDDGCPPDMVLVENPREKVNVCVDIYEFTYESYQFIDNQHARKPAGNLSFYQCDAVCKSQGKRLLKKHEWLEACRGTQSHLCNKDRNHPLFRLKADPKPWYFLGLNCKNKRFMWGKCMQDPRINELPLGLAANEEFPDCVSDYGVRHMVGNLGEWVDGNFFNNRRQLMGQFNGGLYPQPRSSCTYRTVAHGPRYRDYSLGCRCGKNPEGALF